MMYSNSKKAGHWNVKIKHWKDPDRDSLSGHASTNREFLNRNVRADARELFSSGMNWLMNRNLRKAKEGFRLCQAHDIANRQVPAHLDVLEFYSKSQRVANAAIRFLHKNGKAHKFDASGFAMPKYDADDMEEARKEMASLKFKPSAATVAFGLGRAYLALATENKPGWKECAKAEFERALSLRGNKRAEKCMAAAVHRCCVTAPMEPV
jgi:hypothetical protein